MALDAGTLVAALALVSAVLAALLALSWLQQRGAPLIGAWTLAFGLCAAAALLVAARDQLAGYLALDAANTLRLLALGIAWRAARRLSNRQSSWILTLAPAVLWLAASLFLFGDALRPRILVGAPLVAAYALAAAAELWRGPARITVARAAAAVLALHGVVLLARFFGALAQSEAAILAGLVHPLHPAALVETLLVAVALAFLLLASVKEHVAFVYRQAALLDPLTGVANRRGFDAEAMRMLARAGRNGTSTALLLLDLDHFKSVNDRWGHLAGDRALQVFTDAVVAELRAGDLLGRLGGEEFAVALAECRADQAVDLAERIRRAVAALVVRHGAAEITLTASIGVAGRRGADSLDRLMREADAALYRAKAAGRDCVELAPALPAAAAAEAQRAAPLPSPA